MVFRIHTNALTEHLAVPLMVTDWTSRRHVRMCKLTLSAKAQSAANAVDMLGVGQGLHLTLDQSNTSQYDHGQQILVR